MKETPKQKAIRLTTIRDIASIATVDNIDALMKDVGRSVSLAVACRDTGHPVELAHIDWIDDGKNDIVGVNIISIDQITEQALREEGFDKDDSEEIIEFWKVVGDVTLCIGFNEYGGIYIRGDVDTEYFFFPGCKTMTDLRQLIKLLGGETNGSI